MSGGELYEDNARMMADELSAKYGKEEADQIISYTLGELEKKQGKVWDKAKASEKRLELEQKLGDPRYANHWDRDPGFVKQVEELVQEIAELESEE